MKTMFEEMGVTYRREGDYLLPNLELPDQNETAPIGKYGRMRLHYLRRHKYALYTALLLSGELNAHLHEVDERAEKQVNEIVTTMAKADGTDEALKANDQLGWIGLMNNYRSCAEELVLKEVVYE